MRSLLILLITSSLAFGDCQSKLAVCTDYVKVLEETNQLKDQKIEILIKQRDEAVKLAADSQPALPGYAYIFIGIAAGLVTGLVIKR